GDKVTLADGPSFTLAPNARLIKRQAATLADLQPGQYVAITAKLQPDGGLLASIVNVFPPEMANTAPGQRPMAGGNLMTNATIEKADGRNFTATFPGGSAKIQLTPDAELTKLAVMTKADLKEGVTVTAQIANGVAQFVNVQ
ncbi:MAG: hypothetical protein NTZ05_05710, partial [Chloroflexi bacterium]|nr:hypothetical protein [Chloroflexota bacterium]